MYCPKINDLNFINMTLHYLDIYLSSWKAAHRTLLETCWITYRLNLMVQERNFPWKLESSGLPGSMINADQYRSKFRNWSASTSLTTRYSHGNSLSFHFRGGSEKHGHYFPFSGDVDQGSPESLDLIMSYSLGCSYIRLRLINSLFLMAGLVGFCLIFKNKKNMFSDIASVKQEILACMTIFFIFANIAKFGNFFAHKYLPYWMS